MNKKHPYEFARKNFETEDSTDQAVQHDVIENHNETTEDLPTISDEELTALAKERLCTDCPQFKEAEEARLRALAEADNARKRMAREMAENARYAASNVLNDILPSLDNLDLALQHAKDNEACKDFFIGVDMTRKLLLDALERHGLKPVGNIGEDFDPSKHEAMGMDDNPAVPEGAISELMNRGYMLHERLLRPAKVIVRKKN